MLSPRRIWLSRLFLITILLTLFGCSGSGSGGERSEFSADEEPAEQTRETFIVDQQAGALSLQQALDRVQAGDTIILRAASEPYQSSYRFPGEVIRGFTLANSGTADAPIHIIGEATEHGDRPVIDQGKTSLHDPSAPDEYAEPTVGIYLLCNSYIEIENIEVRYTHNAGISTSLGSCESQQITIRDSHIHHVYGDRYVAAVRLSRTTDSVITNNHLHDVYQFDSEQAYPLTTGDNLPLENILIENNHIHNVSTGIRLEAQHDKSVTGLYIHGNQLEALELAISATVTPLDTDTPATARFSHLEISENLIRETTQGLFIDAGASLQQSEQIVFNNNTVHQIPQAAIQFSGVSGLSVYNNIFSFIGRDLLLANAPLNPTLNNHIALYDNNLYWHDQYTAAAGPEWLLDIGGANPQVFANFSQWISAYSATMTTLLTSDPDQNAQFADPLYSNPGELNFLPQLPFAQNGGRFGDNLGAFRQDFSPGTQP